MSDKNTAFEPFSQYSSLRPEELDAYRREAHRQRSEAFVALAARIGRFLAKPFRRGEAGDPRIVSDRYATHTR